MIEDGGRGNESGRDIVEADGGIELLVASDEN